MQTGSKKSRAGSKSKGIAPKDTFETVAKRLECDEDKSRFEERLGKIAKAIPHKEEGEK